MPVQAINFSFRQPDLGRIDPDALDELDAAHHDPLVDATVDSAGDAGSRPGQQDLIVADRKEVVTVPAVP